jgi:hypothetical protein
MECDGELTCWPHFKSTALPVEASPPAPLSASHRLAMRSRRRTSFRAMTSLAGSGGEENRCRAIHTPPTDAAGGQLYRDSELGEHCRCETAKLGGADDW